MFAPGIGAHHSAKSDGSSLECIWEAGVGVLHSPPSDSVLDNTRTELVRLLVTLSSEPLYSAPITHGQAPVNTWVKLITKSKHSLSILASLINTVCSYDPRFVNFLILYVSSCSRSVIIFFKFTVGYRTTTCFLLIRESRLLMFVVKC